MINKNFIRKKYFKQTLEVTLSEDDSWEALIENLYKDEVQKSGHVFLKEDFIGGIIQQIAQWLEGDRSSCLISGGVGLGKTAILRALMRLFDDCRDPITIPPSRYRPIMFIEAAEWSLKSLRDYDLREEACKCKLLLIDDLGAEELYYYDWGNKLCPIKDVILARYALSLPTIFTTNISPNDLPNRYGERVADRINEVYEIIEYPQRESFRRLF